MTSWWQRGVIYQLYVRSWRDSNGDGYGDLRGIIERLDHLSWLGVDGIWLSPTMPSPDADWGYDVSDYTAVHPELGTLADLDELIAEAGQRGIRVLLDLVPNHTSTAHPWFIDAASARNAAHRDYYVCADAKPSGQPPNNWLDPTGHSAWQWDERAGQYYLHNFLPVQADLNWWNEAVHDEFMRILRFWLDRGVAGFRIDVAHGLYKDALLRDNPPAQSNDPLVTRAGLEPRYSANRPESHAVFRAWRALAESYSPARLLLGETWVRDLNRLAGFYGAGDELQLGFNFPFAFAGLRPAELSRVVSATAAALPEGAVPVWTASNHDIGRFATTWCGADERLIRVALVILLTLPGTTVLYYGDEIGMTNVDVPPGQRRDLMTADRTDPGGNRDSGRTPLRWDGSAGGGFTGGVAPWLPVGAGPDPNVASQRADPGSVLSLCRSLIGLRHEAAGSDFSDFEDLAQDKHTWTYRSGRLHVTVNLGDSPVPLQRYEGDSVLTASGRRPHGDWVASHDAAVVVLRPR
jgi:alpha-glucosidase